MARAQGARAQMALAFETVYGTPPGSGYTQMPFITSSLAAEQPLLASELLGYGRDPRAPLLDGRCCRASAGQLASLARCGDRHRIGCRNGVSRCRQLGGCPEHRTGRHRSCCRECGRSGA